MPKPPLSWPEVLEAEYLHVHGSRPLDDRAPADPEERLAALHAAIHARKPTALCLSGGGIRSATFALGVLQGLAAQRVIGSIDYLSTVSGGGYIGGWFTAWLHREGAAGRAAVLSTIDPTARLTSAVCGDVCDETSPVERVRRTCRYLALQGGVVSADVWSLATTLARNLLLNWLVILPLLAAALLVPRIYYRVVRTFDGGLVVGPGCTSTAAATWALAASLLALTLCSGYVVLNFVGKGGRWSQGRFLAWFLAPAVGGSVGVTIFWAAYPCEPSLLMMLVLASGIPAVVWMLLAVVVRMRGPAVTDGATLRVNVGLRTIAAAILSGPILGAGIWWLDGYQYNLGQNNLRELYALFGVPLVLGLTLLHIVVFIGVASSELDDAVLEWWSRCGAWLGIAATIWTAAGVLVFFMADAIEFVVIEAGEAMALSKNAGAALFGTLIPLLSSIAGLLSRQGTPGQRPSALRAAVQRLALPLIIALLLATIAWANLRATAHPLFDGLGGNVLLTIVLVAIGLLMSWLVPVNRFSLHGMYRQRLIRTFLGASRPDRVPNAFTGFDAHDDVCVHNLADVRPLHVINATLNTVSATHLGRREIQAESFTFTPLHVGNHDLGYRKASEYGSDGGGMGTGLSLGMALAVSGAAASPAMGIFSSKARAFLLTLANARLGLWFGNPASAKTWQRSEPPFGVEPLMRELLGLTTDHNPYVYLSDGGHYENLGLWEMVARRCHFIIVSDAGCDPEYRFDDLANAVRRIRLDLGIPIQFEPIPMTRDGQGRTNPHFAIGTIRYGIVDGPSAPNGVLLYLKATLSGDEPVDVKNFAASDPTFPHDTTANQFFDEARFESYRTLGFHTILAAADTLAPLAGRADRVSMPQTMPV